VNTVVTAAPAAQIKVHNSTPSFPGIVRGEIFKITRQWTTWILLVLLLGTIILPYIIVSTAPNIIDNLRKAPLNFFYNEMEIDLSVLRIFIGIFLLVLTARVIGLEYQLGTIRVLLARGVGRLQLLSAKLLTIVIVALTLFIVGILLDVILTCSLVAILMGNLNSLNALTSAFWSNTWLYTLSVLISMGVTILLAAALSVVGRSLSFGLSASLAWFPADNVGSLIFLMLAFRITHSDFWRNVSAYLLGPNLNVMPAVLLPAQIKANSIGITPLVDVDGTHTLLVTLVYALIFAVVAVVLTWRRDVKE
jgi:ABC-2 type transport system permease protein